MKKLISSLLVLPLVLSTTSCASLIKKVAIDSTGYVIEDALKAFFAEEDVILASEAAPANLKLMEGLITGDPENEKLLLMGCKLFTGYAFGFLETQFYYDDDEDLAEANNARAKALYARAMAYGMKVLNRDQGFREAMQSGSYEAFEKAVKKMGKDKLEILFWTAYSWGNWINMSKSEPAAIANLGKVAIMMNRVLELDETYYNAGAHLFFIVYYGGRPAMLGGNPEKAKEHYERAREITKGKFFMVDQLYAAYYTIQVQDRELFEELLHNILKSDPAVYPEERLANEIAQKRAKLMLELADDLF